MAVGKSPTSVDVRHGDLRFERRMAYLMVPGEYCASFWIRFPCSSIASAMSHVARAVAIAIKTEDSAKWIPGQALVKGDEREEE